QPVAAASAKEWANGVEIKHGLSFNQSKELRNLIFKKNELYFHKYRPLNRTYILGFRAYEQGRHKQGLEELDGIVTWLDTQISLNKPVRTSNYQLTPIQYYLYDLFNKIFISKIGHCTTTPPGFCFRGTK